ncbi:uncharacterized protein [Anoplolepis gracilipes]|uniref:uncharacterized protein n=1 Tax=Anoplolepis gracilipes TaxID=354296 RepID=UPI003B9DEC9A
MREDQFLLVLPSNSSIRYFPDNTTSSFIMELPQSIQLHGEWEVALSEIQFPNTFFHIQRGENILTFADVDIQGNEEKDSVIISREDEIRAGIYKNMDELFDAIITTCKGVSSHFRLDRRGLSAGSIEFYLECDENKCKLNHYVNFSDKLLRILGLGDALYNAPKQEGRYYTMLTTYNPDSKKKSTSIFVKLGFEKEHFGFFSYEPCSLARDIPDKLFVYCDICEPYITGDVQSPLLRIVSVEGHGRDYEYGTNQVEHFSSLHYIPLRRTNFSRIEIDIRDQFGKKITFESGTSTVTLHFRRTR